MPPRLLLCFALTSLAACTGAPQIEAVQSGLSTTATAPALLPAADLLVMAAPTAGADAAGDDLVAQSAALTARAATLRDR